MRMDGPITTFLTKLCDLFIVSLFWLIGCIPIITIGTSTASLYYAVVKVIRKDTGYLYKEFLHAYKDNLKTGIIVTVIMEVLILLVFYNRYVTQGMEGDLGVGLNYFYIFLLVLMACMILYLCPVMSRFSVRIRDLFKMSFFMMIRHFPTTLVTAVLLVGSYILCVAAPAFLIVIPGAVCLLDSLLMERVLLKYIPKPEEGSEEAQKWYFQ